MPKLTFALALTCLASTAAAEVPSEQVDALIESGVGYLAEQQQDDGTWQPAEQVPTAYTALALRALVAERGVDDPAVARGYDALVAQQNPDGGIYTDLLANYNTAISVSALAAANDLAGDGRFDEPITGGVAYLKKLQWTPGTTPDFAGDDVVQQVESEDDPFYGGWGYGGRSRGAGRPDLSNLQMSIQALHDAGLDADDPAYQRAVQFMTRLQNNSETNSQAWASDDGGFIYGPSGDRTFESQAGEYVTPTGDRRLRSYGSMTYAGLKSMIYAGLTRDDPRVAAAFDWVRDNWTLDENPGMAELAPDRAKEGQYYYFLTLAKALDVYDQPVLETPHAGSVDWRVALIDKLGELQNADGSWTGDPRWQEDDPVLVTSYAVTALQAARKDLAEHPAE